MREAEFLNAIRPPHGGLTIARLNFITWNTGARNYLEIGVCTGSTFRQVNFRHKVGVDPEFRFDWQAEQSTRNFLYQTTSDDFFAKLENGAETEPLRLVLGGRPVFDVIFIDGLHTFEQSLRDFENSLAHAGENTVWIIDDTVPSDPYSAQPDADFSAELREMMGIGDKSWHGDVYKTVFAIHDKYPDYSYCTLMGFNPQTVVWKSGPGGRKPAFDSLEEIAGLDYFDMLRHAALMRPVNDNKFPQLFGRRLDPDGLADDQAWKKLIYLPFKFK